MADFSALRLNRRERRHIQRETGIDKNTVFVRPRLVLCTPDFGGCWPFTSYIKGGYFEQRERGAFRIPVKKGVDDE